MEVVVICTGRRKEIVLEFSGKIPCKGITLQDDQYEKNSIQHTEMGIRETLYEECAILQRLSIIIEVF